MGYRDVVLVILLALDGLQLAAAGAAILQGSRRRGRGEDALARYSFGHARVLAGGAIVLAVPMILGLADVVTPMTAIWIVIGAEIVGVAVGRVLVERLHRAAHA
jgi:hypothetical protein